MVDVKQIAKIAASNGGDETKWFNALMNESHPPLPVLSSWVNLNSYAMVTLDIYYRKFGFEGKVSETCGLAKGTAKFSGKHLLSIQDSDGTNLFSFKLHGAYTVKPDFFGCLKKLRVKREVLLRLFKDIKPVETTSQVKCLECDNEPSFYACCSHCGEHLDNKSGVFFIEDNNQKKKLELTVEIQDDTPSRVKKTSPLAPERETPILMAIRKRLSDQSDDEEYPPLENIIYTDSDSDTDGEDSDNGENWVPGRHRYRSIPKYSPLSDAGLLLFQGDNKQFMPDNGIKMVYDLLGKI